MCIRKMIDRKEYVLYKQKKYVVERRKSVSGKKYGHLFRLYLFLFTFLGQKNFLPKPMEIAYTHRGESP